MRRATLSSPEEGVTDGRRRSDEDKLLEIYSYDEPRFASLFYTISFRDSPESRGSDLIDMAIGRPLQLATLMRSDTLLRRHYNHMTMIPGIPYSLASQILTCAQNCSGGLERSICTVEVTTLFEDVL